MAARKRVKAKPTVAPLPANNRAESRVETVERSRKPEAGPKSFPIVGIGASAGGLAAFEAFFSGMPAGADPGMAFVIVQHLAPDHKSILTELIQRYTRMRVFEVEDGMTVRPNSVYIIPPNHDMALLNGHLQLLEPSAPRGLRLPIDFFFRSLAQDQNAQAIGIVLSGTGSDGALGVRAIKGEGGMVMAQTPESTEFGSMPRSAIATGLVDCVLTPSDMPSKLIAYTEHVPGGMVRTALPQSDETEAALKKISVLLRARTGHDFSQYKFNTVTRRIERRMALQHVERIGEYVRFLQNDQDEADALFRDLLIGVTNFFRDPEAFLALERHVVPGLFEDKQDGTEVRVWIPGCSTGEEAYSIAILLQERMGTLKRNSRIQVFATDIDDRAIETARTGIYPASISADVSPERLARFFTREPDGAAYRIRKSTRDLLVFSEQDVVKDPPFSRLDLISCRNMLIYMDRELQQKIIPLFHYALTPGGTLFLGTSETVGEFADLFVAVDRKSKLYQRREGGRSMRRVGFGTLLPSASAGEPSPVPPPGLVARGGKDLLRELAERAILQQYAASAVLVDEHGDILYLHGRTGRYLEPTPGETVMNVLRMAREGLRSELTSALQKVVVRRKPVYHAGLKVRTNGEFSTVDLYVQPVQAGQGTRMFLVVMQDVPAANRKKTGNAGTRSERRTRDEDTRIAELRRQLQDKDEYLQSTNEELRSANEEMQSVNEELQSTNEELETSKEELQSVNEELSTVNAELQTKVVDLSRANNDMTNLLAGTGIGTVFVDHELRILRFTPAAVQIINLIQSDVGRPVGHIVPNLIAYDRLSTDVKTVLDTLVPVEKEVQTKEGKWYTMRIQPYRTLDNVIEGAVLTFVNITEMVKVREESRRNAECLRKMQGGGE